MAVVGFYGVGRHEVLRAIMQNSPRYHADQLITAGDSVLRRIDESIQLFTVPGLVSLQPRDCEHFDYLFKCHPRGFVEANRGIEGR